MSCCISAAISAEGTSSSTISISLSMTCALSLLRLAALSSRFILFATSSRKASLPPSSTPKLLKNSSSTAGSTCSLTLLSTMSNSTALPANSALWYSSGKLRDSVNASPADLPMRPASKPGIMRSEPMTKSVPSALPP